jgi:hypothetical protein
MGNRQICYLSICNKNIFSTVDTLIVFVFAHCLLPIAICTNYISIADLREMPEKKEHRGYIRSVIGCRCPRCRDGKLFTHPLSIRLKQNMIMNKACPVCGQPTEIEVGFYYGTSYVSYVLTVALSVASFIVWWLIVGISIHDNRVFYWLLFNAILLIALQPWLMRLSRSLWISWFVRFDPDWQHHQPVDVSERMNSDQSNNW